MYDLTQASKDLPKDNTSSSHVNLLKKKRANRKGKAKANQGTAGGEDEGEGESIHFVRIIGLLTLTFSHK
jgi:hypothetical protein